MKKLFTLIFMLSFLLLGGANATVKTVLSWDFATYAKTQTDKTFVSTSGTVNVSNVACDLLTGDFAGLAVQGAAPNAQGQGGWMWRSAGNLLNANSGGRKLVILGLKKDDVITLTSSATQTADVNVTAVDGETNKFTVSADGNASLSITKSTNITALTVSRDVPEGTCEDPTASVTGVNGTKRIITLACTTDDSEIYYSETELTTAEGGTKYENPFETEATTIYAYAKTETSSSNVISFNTGAGSTVTLATPTLKRTALTGEGYTVSLASDQTGILCKPSAKIMYSIDDAAAVEYSDPITLAIGATIKAYATATGYANSANVEYTAVVPEGYTTSKALDFTSYAEGKGSNDTGSTINVSGTNLEKFLVDDVAVDEDFYVQPVNGSYKFYIHVAGVEHGLYCFYGGGRLIGLANQKKDDIIKINASIAPTAGLNLQALPDYSYGDTYYFKVVADGNCGLNIQRYTYIRSIEVLTEAPAVTEIELTNTDFIIDNDIHKKLFIGEDAEGNNVSIAYDTEASSLTKTGTRYIAADEISWFFNADEDPTGTFTETSEGASVDVTVKFDGKTYHITGTYEAPATPVHVSTFPNLYLAMTSENKYNEVILDADITIPYSFQAKGKKILNANGHKITCNGYISFSAKTTITGNGTFERADGFSYQMLSVSKGADLTIENGTFMGGAGILISASAGQYDYGTIKMTINDGVFIANQRVMHFQNETANVPIDVTINGGVFVTKEGYFGPIDDYQYNQRTQVTINKGAFASIGGSKVFYLYSTGTNITIPAGKTYVIDGTVVPNINSGIAEPKDARDLPGKVLYVGKSSDFSLFNLMDNENASTNVFNQTSGGGAYGHQAHSAVFVTATPEAGYAKVKFTKPADATVYDLGDNNYCVMPYTAGMTVSAKGEKVQVSEIAITTKTGCIPELGQNFWERKTTIDECKTMINYDSPAFRVTAMHWRKKADQTMQESSAVCESGTDYELYMKYSLSSGYELADEVTVTVDGKTARIEKGYKEIYLDYSIAELPITITKFTDYRADDGPVSFRGLDAEGNRVSVGFYGDEFGKDLTGYVASDNEWNYAATAGTGSYATTSEGATLDATVTFTNGKTYHITGTYTFSVYPLTEPAVTADMTSIKIVWTDEVISDNDGFRLAEGYVILTVGDDVYEGSMNEKTDAVGGKLTVTIPFDQVRHILTSDPYTPVKGDNISIKIEGAEIDAKATEESDWKEIWSGDIDGLTAIVDNTTGINSVSSAAAKNATIYNLAGQRVNAKAKGLVIKSGKKVFVK